MAAPTDDVAPFRALDVPARPTIIGRGRDLNGRVLTPRSSCCQAAVLCLDERVQRYVWLLDEAYAVAGVTVCGSCRESLSLGWR